MQDAPVRTRDDLDRLRLVYEEIHSRLWRAVLAWSGSRDVADEAVADAFAQAARRGAELRDPAAWIWRATFRIAAGELARRRRSPQTPLDGVVDLAAPDTLPPGEAVDLLRALQQLSDQQRQAIVLVDAAGLTAPEAAAVLQTTPATIRVQLMRARRRLRTLLADDLTEETTHE
jgi:RNA polymerase sigma-70 factor, ECF subfamily